MTQIKTELSRTLSLIASGKVRELYEVDAHTLLFVASDRISAYDVIMDNVSFVWLYSAYAQLLNLYGRIFPTKASFSH